MKLVLIIFELNVSITFLYHIKQNFDFTGEEVMLESLLFEKILDFLSGSKEATSLNPTRLINFFYSLIDH